MNRVTYVINLVEAMSLNAEVGDIVPILMGVIVRNYNGDILNLCKEHCNKSFDEVHDCPVKMCALWDYRMERILPIEVTPVKNLPTSPKTSK